jgi:hypothetical protein
MPLGRCRDLSGHFWSLGLHFGRSWRFLGLLLRSLGVIWVSFRVARASKMEATGDQADIAKTYENVRFY